MDRQPVLEGERLLLRPLRPGDQAALYAIASDPRVWEQHPQPDRWREPVFAAYFADLLERGGSLAVIDRRDGAMIGTSRFQYGSPDGGGTIEIGSTLLGHAYWGGGINRETKRLMIAYALAHVARVEFWVWRGNARSCRAVEKIGGQRLDRVEQVDIGGRVFDHLVFEITREGFAAGPLAN